jgi:predicted AlkP superfamily pyrophosphatase or phosphodiesterase
MTEQEQNQEQEGKIVEMNSEPTEQQLQEKEIKELHEKSIQYLQNIIDNRIKLSETNKSTDVIQRVRVLKEILELKFIVPKYVNKGSNQKPEWVITDSFELSFFDNYGSTEQEGKYFKGIKRMFVDRLIELTQLI